MALSNKGTRLGSSINASGNNYQAQLFNERVGSPSSFSNNTNGAVPGSAPPILPESLLLMETSGNLLLENDNTFALEQQ